MTSSMLRRQLKNLVQNYSEAEVKVREATSNDPWGPSSTQMADISDLTYNAVACNEIMTMLWKRLKDDKNWRHIHKSLTLLEYILKTGDDRVLLKMKDNIYIVKALTEYRFVEKDGKDQGVNVREKAKVVLVLMEDDEKLKAEREFAVMTREKTSKGSAASSSDAIKDPSYKPCYVPGAAGLPSLDNIPSVADLTASFAARKEERLRQESEKKDAERRAKMSDDELKWEDAGKGTDTKVNAWGKEKAKEEEGKSDTWEAPKEPSSDLWGAPTKTEDPFAAAKADEDPFAAPKNGEDPFAAPKNGEDPFAAPKDKSDPFGAPKDDPFNAPKDAEDPFAAPQDKPDPFSSSNSDPFNAPKDDPFNAPKDDPFNAPKDDPFNAPKDDPFNAPKDDPFNAPKDDPFNAPKDDPFNAPKDDPFNAPKDDPFNAPKDDPFNAPKDDPFNAPKDDPFNAPKDDPFNAPKDDPFNASNDDPFNAPKDDSFNAPKDDPFNAPNDDPFNAPKDDSFNAPKDDPFNTPKNDRFITSSDDPFNAPKDDPFTSPASTPPKDEPLIEPTPQDDPFTAPITSPKDPFSAPTKLVEDDPFAAPTTPPQEDPFSSTAKPTKDDPFAAPSPPPKEDPFTVPSSPPKDDASDPFSAPPLGSPQDSADTWGGLTSSPPATGSDAWGAAPAPKETKGGDPWGNGASASSPVDNADPFGDPSKPDSDPWGAPASAPVTSDDAWGTPAPPSDSSPSGDPFGASKNNDPWGPPSSTSGSGTGKRTVQEDEMYRKTASFLGAAGESLVDLDDLFSSHPKPRQRPLITALAAQTQAIGAFKAKGMPSAPMASSGAFAETSAQYSNPFGSLAPSRGAISPTFGAADPTGATPLFQQLSHCPASMLQTAPVAPEMVQPVFARGNLQMARGKQLGVGMMQSGFAERNSLGAGDGLSTFFLGNDPTGAGHFSGVDETPNQSSNPFLF
ncbi:uncharacterized protein [Leuresthes tenuis]|uniref:uncharacterized protein isoform X1 n=1 Tax=Leuresthes tenuis TaxID=355514 RepID=UPI003B502DF2